MSKKLKEGQEVFCVGWVDLIPCFSLLTGIFPVDVNTIKIELIVYTKDVGDKGELFLADLADPIANVWKLLSLRRSRG